MEMETSRKEIKFNQFDSICRFCLKRDLFLKPLFYDQIDEQDDFASDDGCNETVTEMIEFCTQMKICPEDNLPQFMCSACCDQLVRCNKFRRQCRESEETLQRILDRYNMKDNSSDNLDDEDDYSAIPGLDTVEMEYAMEAEELAAVQKRSIELFGSMTTACSSRVQEEAMSDMVNRPSRLEGTELQNRFRQCQVCGAKAKGLRSPIRTNRSKLLRRQVDEKLNSHSGKINQKYKCSVCDQSSDSLLYKNRSHLQQRRYKCAVCQKFFHTDYGFKRHCRLHRGRKPFKCDRCSKRFTASSYLAAHKKLHNRSRLLKCGSCSLNFVSRLTFRLHLKRHR